MYLNGNDQIMPLAASMPSLKLTDEPRIADVLAPYLNNEKALQCPSDNDRNFFESEGSSYQYNTVLGGQAVGKDFMTQRLGPSRMPVMHDYEPFHGPAGQKGSTNYLFADLHVGDLE
jgi:prepilin-type processing-associated H-X9-DG protein